MATFHLWRRLKTRISKTCVGSCEGWKDASCGQRDCVNLITNSQGWVFFVFCCLFLKECGLRLGNTRYNALWPEVEESQD